MINKKENSNFRLIANSQIFEPLQKFFRRKTARDLLPVKPVEIAIEAWWVVQAAYITEDDIKVGIFKTFLFLKIICNYRCRSLFET